MSTFSVLLFTSKEVRNRAWKTAKYFGLELTEQEYGIDPVIEMLHLFVDPSVINPIMSHFHLGKEFQTIKSMMAYQTKYIDLQVKMMKESLNDEDYEYKMTNYLILYEPLKKQLEIEEAKIAYYQDQGKDYTSDEYSKIYNELDLINKENHIYHLLSLNNDVNYWRSYWANLFESDNSNLKYYAKNIYPTLIDFIEAITQECDDLSFIIHHSDHSENEHVPIIEEREIKFKDITIETFAFLPSNVLLRIIK